ncbi:MAG: hypothetical protein QM750_14170 [Rubrivivax sp.]
MTAALALVVLLAACGGGGSSTNPTPDPDPPVTPPPVTPPPVAPMLTLLAGGFNGNARDGSAEQAGFLKIDSLAVDSRGLAYVGDHRAIRRINAGGEVTTLAGDLMQPGNVDGQGAAARFGPTFTPVSPDCSVFGYGRYPCLGVALDRDGPLLVADSAVGRLRSVSTTGLVSARCSSQPGWASALGVAVNAQGVTVFVQVAVPSEMPANPVFGLFIRRCEASASLPAYAKDVAVEDLGAMVFNDLGDLYVSDVARVESPAATRIWRIAANGDKTLFVGESAGIGLRAGAMAFDAAGRLYLADTAKRVVRRFSPDGTMTVLVGQLGVTTPGLQLGALPGRLSQPDALAVDRANQRLLIGDRNDEGRPVVLTVPLAAGS